MIFKKKKTKQELINEVDEEFRKLGYEKQFESNTIIKYIWYTEDLHPRFVLIISRKMRSEESMISLREFLPNGNFRFLTRIRANLASLAYKRAVLTFDN